MKRPIVGLAAALLLLVGACGAQSDAKAQGQGGPAAAGSAAAAAAAQAPEEDLFAFAAGTLFVGKPEEATYSDLNYGPYNLTDESLVTDWTGSKSPTPVFVLEMAERVALDRVAFDTAGMNRDEKGPKRIRVEVSDQSATAGFSAVLETELKMGANDQSFPLASKPQGRWVRLTVLDNHGDDYVGFLGFHGYGRRLTAAATLPDVSGTYEGANGWGIVRLKQEGTRVLGCYDYRDGVLSGGVEGRMIKVQFTEQVHGGGTERLNGLLTVPVGGGRIFGFSRSEEGVQEYGWGMAYVGEKISDDIGDCPRIPGWKRADAAGSQLGSQLDAEGRVRLDGVNFDFNSANLRPESKPLLDQVAAMLKARASLAVTLEGHTDNVGGEAFNQGLSARRAEAVKAYLVSQGVGADRLRTQGFGYSKPIGPNDTAAGRAQNRRVEIVKN